MPLSARFALKLLLDTHVLLWALHAPERLTAESRAMITDGSNEVFFSAASVWELAIKSSRGKLDLDPGFPKAAEQTRFTEIPIRISHAWMVRDLPPIHGDPFDRLLIAQAQMERLTLVTRDRLFAQYGLLVIDA